MVDLVARVSVRVEYGDRSALRPTSDRRARHAQTPPRDLAQAAKRRVDRNHAAFPEGEPVLVAGAGYLGEQSQRLTSARSGDRE
jgi:hypothetical protein